MGFLLSKQRILNLSDRFILGIQIIINFKDFYHITYDGLKKTIMFRSIQARIATSIISLLILVWIDSHVTSEISLALLYLIPVIIFSYQNTIPYRYSILFGIITTSAWFIIDYYTNSYSSEINQIINCIPKFLISIITAVAIHQYFIERELRKTIVDQKKDLENANQQLKESNTELNKFIGMAAHDIRNPVGSIQMFAEMLMEKESITEEDKTYIKMVETAAGHSLQILNDTLNISKIQSGTISMNKKKTDYISFIKETIALNKYLADKKNQTIHFESTIDELEIEFDQSRLAQVINNLMTNAIKYSNMNTSIIVKVDYYGEKNEMVLTSIKDQGLGIDEKYHATLFDPFTTTANQPTNNESKTGLGLAIVKKIVQLHAGSIGFTSEKGKGSNFFFFIPIA